MARENYEVGRHIIRSIYRGVTNPWEACKRALTVINRTFGYGKVSEMLHIYNHELYRARG